MKYSPSFPKPLLPAINGSPPPSPSARRSTLGIMQAASLSACSAAFAAITTGILCILTLSSKSYHGSWRPPMSGMYSEMSIQAHLDYPHNGASRSVKCNSIHSMQDNESYFDAAKSETAMEPRNYDRRSLPDINPEATNIKQVSRQHESSPPGVVWLMSFPNSGTSYTIHAVRELSNTTTATNYGLEGDIRDKESVPVFPESEDGPYLELIPGRAVNKPNLIITKTHCGGFCATCTPELYIETPRSFLKSCLKGKRGVFSPESESMVGVSVGYSPSLVRKTIHIIRNPMDNVVARFHLERKRYSAKKNEEWLATYPNNKLGFHKWCKNMDESKALSETRWVDKELAKSMSHVLCHAEFYRYIQWHNLAFTVASDLDIPTYVFYYEDYSTNFEAVTNDLLSFLELERIGVAPPFMDDKKYGGYYSAEQKNHIMNFIREYSTKRTWDHLNRRYFSADSSNIATKERRLGRTNNARVFAIV